MRAISVITTSQRDDGGASTVIIPNRGHPTPDSNRFAFAYKNQHNILSSFLPQEFAEPNFSSSPLGAVGKTSRCFRGFALLFLFASRDMLFISDVYSWGLCRGQLKVIYGSNHVVQRSGSVENPF